MSAPDPRDALRERLAAMRAGLVETMARDGYSAGAGALLAGIAAALDEAQGSPVARVPAGGQPKCRAERSRARSAAAARRRRGLRPGGRQPRQRQRCARRAALSAPAPSSPMTAARSGRRSMGRTMRSPAS
jgi:hypothetical protein